MIYEPAEDSHLLEKQIERYAKNKICLDVGSGSGILAEACINLGAKSILATDINPESIKLLRQKKIPSIKSDLFRNIKEKFDLIIFNPPYLPEDTREPQDSKIATTGGKNGDEIILKFLTQVLKHLNKNGTILLLLSSLTPRSRIISLLKKSNLKKRKIVEKKLFMELLEIWEIKHNNQ